LFSPPSGHNRGAAPKPELFLPFLFSFFFFFVEDILWFGAASVIPPFVTKGYGLSTSSAVWRNSFPFFFFPSSPLFLMDGGAAKIRSGAFLPSSLPLFPVACISSVKN